MPDSNATPPQADGFGDRLADEMRRGNGGAPGATDVGLERPLDSYEQVRVAEPFEQKDDDNFFDEDDGPAGDEGIDDETDEQESEPEAVGTGSVGTGEYVVRSGDCLASISLDHGFFWETLWNDPQNSELKSVREDPYVLLPGDRVHIREKRRKDEPGQTEMRHRFKRKGEPATFRLTVLQADEPRANEPYRLEIDGDSFAGTLDENGTLEVVIPGNARNGMLFVGTPPEEDQYELRLGGLNPDSEASGIRTRLANLGYDCNVDDDDEELDDPTQAALVQFQAKHQLPTTGEADEGTRRSLEDEHFSD